KLNNGSSSCGNQRCLYIFIYQASALNIHTIKNFTNNVEGGNQIEPCISHIKANRFSYFHMERLFADHGTYVAVKNYIIGIFFNGFFHIERLEARISIITFGIKVALHNVEFSVHRIEPSVGLYQN